MRWSIVLYGLVLGLLLAALQFFQYRFWVIDNARELYTGLVALLFVSIGIWAGRKWRGAAPHPDDRAVPALPTAPVPRETPAAVIEQLGLTSREVEVLQLLAHGHTNQEIAGRLFISLNTVKTHVSNLFSKLGVERRTQAVHKAKALGLVE